MSSLAMAPPGVTAISTSDAGVDVEAYSALVLVEGEAGSGKSSRLNEHAGRMKSHRIGRAKCVELDRDLSFVPIAAALRGLTKG